MTQSLDRELEAALVSQVSWDENRLKDLLFICQSIVENSVIDWETGDENWARLLKDGRVLLIVNAQIPLAFFDAEYADQFRDVLSECVFKAIESFSSSDFSVDVSLLKQVAGRDVSDNLDYTHISIDDLWWATI